MFSPQGKRYTIAILLSHIECVSRAARTNRDHLHADHSRFSNESVKQYARERDQHSEKSFSIRRSRKKIPTASRILKSRWKVFVAKISKFLRASPARARVADLSSAPMNQRRDCSRLVGHPPGRRFRGETRFARRRRSRRIPARPTSSCTFPARGQEREEQLFPGWTESPSHGVAAAAAAAAAADRRRTSVWSRPSRVEVASRSRSVFATLTRRSATCIGAFVRSAPFSLSPRRPPIRASEPHRIEYPDRRDEGTRRRPPSSFEFGSSSPSGKQRCRWKSGIAGWIFSAYK